MMNDFHDNLGLYFYGVQLRDSDGNIHLPRYPQRDRWGNLLQLPQDRVWPYAALGYNPPINDLEALVGKTQLGTLALRVLDRAGSMVFDRSFDGQVEATREYLAQLRDSASGAGQQTFSFLLIPPTRRYR